MKFCDNLQKLRKEHHLSQEQLAEKLNVSRQAVSKWESGSSYPETDKMIMMCKIFNCSLDELINENISLKKGKENINFESKFKWQDYFNKIINFINKTVDYFCTHSLGEGIKTIIFMLLIVLILIIVKIPIENLENIGINIFYRFPNVIGTIVSDLWKTIIEIAYFVFTIFVIINVFKHRYLDKEIINESIEIKNKEKTNNKINDSQIIKNQSKISISDIILKIFLWCLKGLTIIIAIPLVFSLLFIVVAFAFSIYLLFQKVFYLGFTISLLASLILNIVLLQIIFNFVFNIKYENRRIFITLISGIIILGIGISIMFVDIANSKYIDKVPGNLHKTIKTEEFDMQNDLMIQFHWLASKVNYEENPNIGNKVQIELQYYDDYTNFEFISDGNNLNLVQDTKSVSFKNIYELIIKDLQHKTFHNYNAINQVKITIITSKENINTLKENLNKYQDYSNYYINNLENELSLKEEQLEDWQDKYDGLKEEYEEKISEYQEKIEEYKNSIKVLD